MFRNLCFGNLSLVGLFRCYLSLDSDIIVLNSWSSLNNTIGLENSTERLSHSTEIPDCYIVLIGNMTEVAFYLKKYVNNIFFIFLKLFLISIHQNNLKTLKIY
jgi:hypothetical protein